MTDARIAHPEAAARAPPHAVAMAKQALDGFSGTVLVVYADAPLDPQRDRSRLGCRRLTSKAPMAVSGLQGRQSHGYGRLIRNAKGQHYRDP